MVKAAIVNVDGNIEIKNLNGYDDLSSSVQGWLEALRFSTGMTGYVNEEGKLKNLPLNPLATYICNKMSVGLSFSDYIVGPMVCVGPVDSEGEDTDLSSEMIAEVISLQKSFFS